MMFGYPTLAFVPIDISNTRDCFIRCETNTKKFVKNTPLRVIVLTLFSVLDIEDTTWLRVDTNFIFECTTRYIASESNEQVGYRVVRHRPP